MGLPGQAGSQDPWTTGCRIAKIAGADPSSGPTPTTTLPWDRNVRLLARHGRPGS